MIPKPMRMCPICSIMMEKVDVFCMAAIRLEDEYTKTRDSNENMITSAHKDVSPFSLIFPVLFITFFISP